jgi:hypothetical protein
MKFQKYTKAQVWARYSVIRLKDGKEHQCARKPWKTSKAWDKSKYVVWDNKANVKAEPPPEQK